MINLIEICYTNCEEIYSYRVPKALQDKPLRPLRSKTYKTGNEQ